MSSFNGNILTGFWRPDSLTPEDVKEQQCKHEDQMLSNYIIDLALHIYITAFPNSSLANW